MVFFKNILNISHKKSLFDKCLSLQNANIKQQGVIYYRYIFQSKR